MGFSFNKFGSKIGIKESLDIENNLAAEIVLDLTINIHDSSW